MTIGADKYFTSLKIFLVKCIHFSHIRHILEIK